MPKRGRRNERGFALLLVFLMASVIAISLYLEVPRVAMQSERAKEQLLIDRGEQYKRAIQLFTKKAGHYPGKVEELESFQNMRFLRHRYIDPMTGKDEWRMVHIQNGILTDSKVSAPQKQGEEKKDNGSFAGIENSFGSPPGTNPQGGAALARERRRASDGGTAGNGPEVPPAPPAGLITGNVPPQPIEGQQNLANGGPGLPGQPTQVQPIPGMTIAGQPFPTQPGAIQPGVPQPGITQPGVTGATGIPGMTIPGQPGAMGQQNPAQPVVFPGQMGGIRGGVQIPGMPGAIAGGRPVQGQFGAAGANPGTSSGSSSFGSVSNSFGSGTATGTGAPTGAGMPVQPGQAIYPGQPLPGQPGTPVNSQIGGVSPYSTVPGANGNAPGVPQPGAAPGGQNSNAANMINRILTSPRPGGMPTAQTGGAGLGNGIAGVASTSEGESVMVYNDHTKYQEWEFVFDPQKQKQIVNPNVSGAGGTPAQNMGTPAGGMPGTPVQPGAGANPFGQQQQMPRVGR